LARRRKNPRVVWLIGLATAAHTYLDFLYGVFTNDGAAIGIYGGGIFLVFGITVVVERFKPKVRRS
jgi:hypothetical protein